MGIYDRDYYRPPQPGLALRGPQTMVGWLVLVNVAIWIVDSLVPDNQLSGLMAVHGDTLSHPWLWWQFLTYGFAHAPTPQHIIFNMLGLWFLGRDVEYTYGSKEFLRLYLAIVVFAGLSWGVANWLLRTPPYVTMLGASGAVTGIVLLYALHFPRRTLLLFFVLPVPAWLVGVLIVVVNVFGASDTAGPRNIAYSVHLAGAAFAFLYYYFGWNFGRLLGGGISLAWLRRRPKLRIHKTSRHQDDLSGEVDRILAKIHREGADSLTPAERRTLEDASRRYQQQQRP